MGLGRHSPGSDWGVVVVGWGGGREGLKRGESIVDETCKGKGSSVMP